MIRSSGYRCRCSGRHKHFGDGPLDGEDGLPNCAYNLTLHEKEVWALELEAGQGHESESPNSEEPKSPSSEGKGKARLDEHLVRSVCAEDPLNAISDYFQVHRFGGSRRPPLQDDYRAADAHVSGEYEDIRSRDICRRVSSGMQPELDSQVFRTIVDDSPKLVPQPVVSKFCLSCTELKSSGITLQCGHIYCKDCLIGLFDANVNDEYSFPPRCCRQFVPVEHLEDLLPNEKLKLYRTKVEEYSTPHRLYCSNKACTRFLGPRKDHATPVSCSSCSTTTCARCTAAGHAANVRCTIDRELRQALMLGQSKGWQRCPRCRQLVEKNTGCMHMSCRCGAQFCYRCSVEWNKCACSSGRLLVRLTRIWRWKKNGNYLLREEMAGAEVDNVLTKLCKRSWRGVVGVVTLKKDTKTPPMVEVASG